jgi:glucose/arabinose dehydrogenase
MKFASGIAAALLAMCAPAFAQSMTAAEFLAKAEALIRSGRATADSPELLALRDQGLAAGKAVRAQQQADRAAGRAATLCMPERADFEAAELIGFLTGIPRERRNVPLVEAFADFIKIKYPCPARG